MPDRDALAREMQEAAYDAYHCRNNMTENAARLCADIALAHIAAARADALGECVRIVETEEELEGQPSQAAFDQMCSIGPVAVSRAVTVATKKSIARRIRALANEPQP